jgi:hypothetical protein
MSLKSKLGLETFPVREEDVACQISKACSEGVSELVFSSGNCKITIGMDRLYSGEGEQ